MRLHELSQWNCLHPNITGSLLTQHIRFALEWKGRWVPTLKVLFNDVGLWGTSTPSILVPYRSIPQRCNLTDYVLPNLMYDKQRSGMEKSDLLVAFRLQMAWWWVDKRSLIEAKSSTITPIVCWIPLSVRMQRRNASEAEITNTLIGTNYCLWPYFDSLMIYLLLFRKDYFLKSVNILCRHAMLTVSLSSIAYDESAHFQCLCVAVYDGSYLRSCVYGFPNGLYHPCRMILICAATVRYQYEFIIIQLVAEAITIYSLRELSSRSQVF